MTYEIPMNINRRRSKENMLNELCEVLAKRSLFWKQRQKNPYAVIENTSAAGRAEAYNVAANMLKDILEKGK